MDMPRSAWEPAIVIDRDAALPPFLQIARSLAADIHRGRLRPGDRLPGSPRLAAAPAAYRPPTLPPGTLNLSSGAPDVRLVPARAIGRAYRRVLGLRAADVLGY